MGGDDNLISLFVALHPRLHSFKEVMATLTWKGTVRNSGERLLIFELKSQ